MNIEAQTNVYQVPRLVVGAIQGRSGKTTFTIGLLRALRERGFLTQSFKKGPDYIDPSWSTFASGVPCRNLDAVMMSKEQIVHSMCVHTKQSDIAIVEGAMGIFDGLDVQGSNSTAELAYLLQAPVILVVSGQRITRSVAALVNGVVHFDPRIRVAGVVLNQVARPRHLNIMTKSIETYCDVPVLGALPKTKDIEIPDRHLGLIPATEQEALQTRVNRLGALISENVDIDKLIGIAKTAPALEDKVTPIEIKNTDEAIQIGVFKDSAFSFYYPENIEALKDNGATIVEINAIQDVMPEGLSGLYIGGGFPEVLAEELEANVQLREAVKKSAEAGMPIYAECGGLMYLAEEIVSENNHYKMAGVFPCHIEMEKKPVGHGYSVQTATENNPYFPVGMRVLGHEFHHSKAHFHQEISSSLLGFKTERGKGLLEVEMQRYDGLLYKNTMASYHHFHALSSPLWGENFVDLAKQFKQDKKNLLNK